MFYERALNIILYYTVCYNNITHFIFVPYANTKTKIYLHSYIFVIKHWSANPRRIVTRTRKSKYMRRTTNRWAGFGLAVTRGLLPVRAESDAG